MRLPETVMLFVFDMLSLECPTAGSAPAAAIRTRETDSRRRMAFPPSGVVSNQNPGRMPRSCERNDSGVDVSRGQSELVAHAIHCPDDAAVHEIEYEADHRGHHRAAEEPSP